MEDRHSFFCYRRNNIMSEFMNFLLISIFLSFPETILMLLLGLSLCNIKASIKKVLLVAAIQSTVALAVRYANLGFGIHTLVQMGSFCILVAVVLNIKLYKAIVPVLIGTLIEGILSFTIVSGISVIYEIDFSLLNVKFIPTLIFAFPVKLADLILVLIILKTKFSLCNIGEEGEILGE